MNRIIPLIILLVVGCATPREITYTTSFILDTNPKGATVICDGTDVGYSPVKWRKKNIDIFGKNRAFIEQDIASVQGTAGEIWWGEAGNVILGDVKIGESTILTDKEVKRIMEAIKIVDGELDFSEYTASIDAESMQAVIEWVKKVRENPNTCTAYWSSGVSKRYPYYKPYKYAGSENFIYTLQRPEGAGYSQDAEFALKIKQLEQNKQTAELNALIGLRSVQAQERAAVAQAFQSIKSTTCTTTLGITRCY